MLSALSKLSSMLSMPIPMSPDLRSAFFAELLSWAVSNYLDFPMFLILQVLMTALSFFNDFILPMKIDP